MNEKGKHDISKGVVLADRIVCNGNANFSGGPVTGIPLPIYDTDAASKAYVDAEVAAKNLYNTVSTAVNLNLDVAAYFEEITLFVFVDTSGGPAVTIFLPVIANIDETHKKIVHVVDSGGAAQNFNITVQRSDMDLINGDTDVIISQNHNAISFVSDTTSNWYIF